MAISFFNDWQLWEKMTFVLTVAIAGVFFLGYGKLLWMSRLLKKQELADEEKRIKILELRRSGQFVESKKAHDVPFGIRAIQSGIQVDGIWISKSNTPAPSILKDPYLEGSSSDSSPIMDPVTRSRNSMDISSSQPRHSPQRGRSRQTFPPTLSRVSPNDRNDNRDDSERPKSRAQSSYKPRRSSQLRFDTRDESQYNEETLDHLEGRSPTKKVLTHRPRNRPKGNEVESSSDTAGAADNERSSGTSADESDATLSNTKRSLPSPRYSAPTQSLQSTPPTAVQPLRVSMQPISLKGGYFSIPLGSPEKEKSNPFATPLFAPMETSPSARTPVGGSPNHRTSVDTSAPLLPYTRSPSPTFVPGHPGQLHVNKLVRRVNSGFEVLPAGTFGTPAEEEGRDGIRVENSNYDEESGEAERDSKKGRWSMASIRRLSYMDRR